MAQVQLTGPQDDAESTVDSFIANLPELLGALLIDSRCIVVIAEFADHRYVQFWLDSPSYFQGEVISNLNIGELRALSDLDEANLESMGWNRPQPSRRPNWFRLGTCIDDLIEIIDMTRRAVYHVLAEMPSNTVAVSTFEVVRKAANARSDHDESVRTYQLESKS